MAAAGGKSALFVCLGNICRSPIAEAVFKKMATDSGVVDQWVIDSGATSDWNIGSSPDDRGLACLKKHGIDTDHRARQVTKEDFATFEYILCMDESNLRDLKKKADSVKNFKAKIELLGAYDPEKQLIIKDPYYIIVQCENNGDPTTLKVLQCELGVTGKDAIFSEGSEKDFETVYQQCVRCCKIFLEQNS